MPASPACAAALLLVVVLLLLLAPGSWLLLLLRLLLLLLLLRLLVYSLAMLAEARLPARGARRKRRRATAGRRVGLTEGGASGTTHYRVPRDRARQGRGGQLAPHDHESNEVAVVRRGTESGTGAVKAASSRTRYTLDEPPKPGTRCIVQYLDGNSKHISKHDGYVLNLVDI